MRAVRVTRDPDFDISEDADDLLGAVQDQLRQRRFGHVVRLEIQEGASPVVLDELSVPWRWHPATSTSCRACST